MGREVKDALNALVHEKFHSGILKDARNSDAPENSGIQFLVSGGAKTGILHLLITDGIIHDMEQTVSEVVAGAEL